MKIKNIILPEKLSEYLKTFVEFEEEAKRKKFHDKAPANYFNMIENDFYNTKADVDLNKYKLMYLEYLEFVKRYSDFAYKIGAMNKTNLKNLNLDNLYLNKWNRREN